MEGSRDESIPLSRKKINWSSFKSSKMKIQMRAVEYSENRTRLLVSNLGKYKSLDLKLLFCQDTAGSGNLCVMVACMLFLSVYLSNYLF